MKPEEQNTITIFGQNTELPMQEAVQEEGAVSFANIRNEVEINPYAVLGFELVDGSYEHVSGAQIKKAFTQIAKKYHGDKNSDKEAEEVFDYANNAYGRTYSNLFSGSGFSSLNASNGITYSDFKDGMTLYVFDKSGDACSASDNGFNFVGNATLSLSLNFSKQTAEVLSAFVYQEKDDTISIDQEQNVSMIAGVL